MPYWIFIRSTASVSSEHHICVVLVEHPYVEAAASGGAAFDQQVGEGIQETLEKVVGTQDSTWD